jgi:ribosomal protein S20
VMCADCLVMTPSSRRKRVRKEETHTVCEDGEKSRIHTLVAKFLKTTTPVKEEDIRYRRT